MTPSVVCPRRRPLAAALGAVGLLSLCWPALAGAQTALDGPRGAQTALDGPAILQRVDEATNGPRDQSMQARLLLIDKGGSTKERTFEVLQKGSDRRLARFLSPADQKGIAVLSLPGGVIYLYLPAFQKVKRIASHVKNTSFAGTDFTYDDMEAKRYSDHYQAALLRSESAHHVLELRPRKPDESEYGRLVMWVERESFVPVTVEFYDKKDALVRRLTSSGIEKIGGYWIAREREMADLASGHRTRMVLSSIRFDTNLSDDLFSTRYLER